MKRILIAALCLLLLTGAVSAKSSGELRQELNALQAQAETLRTQGAELEEQLEANRTDTQSTIDKKFAVDQQIRQTEAELENVNAQIQQYSLLIAGKQSDLEAAQQAYDAMRETYKTRLRAMEEQGSVSYWSVLFQSRSFADLLDRINMIREIAEADQRMLEELKDAAKQVAREQEQLRQDLRAQDQVRAQLLALEAELERQRAEADQYLKDLAFAMENLTEEYEAMAAQEAAIQKQVMEAQAAYDQALSQEEAARLAQLNQGNAAGGGGGTGTPSASGFLCPVSGAFITDAYGWRFHPVKKKQSFHTGVDFAVSQGTPICAMAAGTVSDCGSNNAYGYYVSLSHGGGYGSFYGHMTNYVVSAGDTVSQGQVIGYVGSTGISTGPHLHFEIYVNGGTVNPMEYVSLS